MIKTLQGNMLEQISAVPDGTIDLLLTDPPYNISGDGANPQWIDPETGKNLSTIHNQRFSENFTENWDAVSHSEFLSQIDSWCAAWFTKIRRGGAFAVFISDQYVSYLWHAMEMAGFEPKRVWTWKKPAAVPFNREVMPVSACEYLVFGIRPGGKRTFNSTTEPGSIVERYASADKISSIVYRMIREDLDTKTLAQIFDAARVEAEKMLQSRKRTASGLIQCVVPNTITYSGGLGRDKIHPTQKPVEILEYFIALLSNRGDTVLDTFAGSGSTGVACYNTGRDCWLIEQDPVMFSKMQNRIDSLSTLLEFS